MDRLRKRWSGNFGISYITRKPITSGKLQAYVYNYYMVMCVYYYMYAY